MCVCVAGDTKNLPPNIVVVAAAAASAQVGRKKNISQGSRA